MSLLVKTAGLIEKMLVSLSRFASVIGIFVLSLMMLLTVADIVLRYFFNKPITGTLEITEYAMVVVVFLGVAWCGVKGGHINVDFMISRFSPRLRLFFDTATCLLSIPLLVLMTWQTFEQVSYTKEIHKASTMLEIPEYPFYLITSIGCALLTLVLINHLIRFLNKIIKER